ncbi:pimeloyl-CoA dehydrogenase large subunit [Exilibacterium tricleocarpae]|uniref:Pimeloyl-CoA dehydrogenase large subunit n=1 Tax=Exilibacterium tricleocarpae TaxID=2591008 RepID=A0A545U3G2_9GAMM|nr:acyl-CoA dehydrogenase family protein [Exilibacterium tricleocarpae]TQV83998.1 pimeloyl-CoA dehydrogenase large subunit [Exilibacterium tricleocarpae]
MNIDLSPAELDFQAQVRQFLEEKLPSHYSDRVLKGLYLKKEEYIDWQKTLYQQGWAATNWPVEHGGTGWTPTQKYIWANECAEAGAPDVIPFGMKMVAPVIYTYGNDEQKERFLPDILASNVWWCQGYSEPNAGSDLASLKTTAVRDGDDYLVNGTKTWTTLGHYGDWIFCLVRTGRPEEKNQEAISFLLIDMTTPGITVSPIITLDGHREVNEVHFDNVRVPVANRVGEEGGGWTYAKVLLTHERTGIARVANSKRSLRQLKKLAAETGDGGATLMENPSFAQKITEVEFDLMALEYTELRTLAAVSTGKAPGPESSILKIKGTEVAQAIDELYVEMAGYYSLPFVKEQFEPDFAGEPVGPGMAADSAPHYFNNRKASIYGGSNEIQKNIICKAVLGL